VVDAQHAMSVQHRLRALWPQLAAIRQLDGDSCASTHHVRVGQDQAVTADDESDPCRGTAARPNAGSGNGTHRNTPEELENGSSPPNRVRTRRPGRSCACLDCHATTAGPIAGRWPVVRVLGPEPATGAGFASTPGRPPAPNRPGLSARPCAAENQECGTAGRVPPRPTIRMPTARAGRKRLQPISASRRSSRSIRVHIKNSIPFGLHLVRSLQVLTLLATAQGTTRAKISRTQFRTE